MTAFRIARWARRALTIVLVAFIGIQFLRPDRTNPPAPAAASLEAKAPPEVKAIFAHSCRDCHSNETRWPGNSPMAPVSGRGPRGRVGKNGGWCSMGNVGLHLRAGDGRA